MNLDQRLVKFAATLGISGIIFLTMLSYYEGFLPFLNWPIEGRVERQVNRATDDMVTAGELARQKIKTELAIKRAEEAATEATRARREVEAIDEAKRVTEAHLLRIEQEKEGLSDEIEHIIAAQPVDPTNPADRLKPWLFDRMRNK